jgi:hypothetical protein
MSGDIVERLRAPSEVTTEWRHIALHHDAAAEIERLRAESERLRARVEALYVCIAQIERAAAAGAIYSEMIHEMALDALKSLEVKP